MAWENRITGEAAVDPATLTANPLNWRTHPKNQVAALRGSLDSLGWVQRIIVNTTTGHVVDGHARLEEALATREAEVPVVYVELTEDEERQALATLDPISALAGAESAALDALLASVISADVPGALAEMLADLGEREVTMDFQETEASYVENPITARNERVAGEDFKDSTLGLKPFTVYLDAGHAAQFRDQMIALGARWGITNPSDVVVRAVEREFQLGQGT